MQKSYRFVLTVLILGSFLLSACAGAVPQGSDSTDNSNVNSNEVLDVDANSSDDGSTANDNGNDNGDDSQGNENDNGDDSGSDASGDELELFGVIEAMTDTSITINGVVFNLAEFTEFKDIVSVGDQVKIHFIVNADGTFTIREIELSSGDDDDSSNSNSNFNGNDNDDDDDDRSNNNGNDNDDDDNENDNHNDNDNKNDNDDD
ncbi:MAG TPA: DUF5666 domain-containing protein [Anaerolineales bacterium]|nr:DUF5666 domain-containing protein [Anaerolineales bacterium]